MDTESPMSPLLPNLLQSACTIPVLGIIAEMIPPLALRISSAILGGFTNTTMFQLQCPTWCQGDGTQPSRWFEKRRSTFLEPAGQCLWPFFNSYVLVSICLSSTIKSFSF